MTPVQRKIVEWIINYESNHSEDDSGPVNADALRACLAAADRCASAEADLARVTAERDAARDDIAQLRAIIARMSAELDEAIEDRNAARDDAARAAAMLAVRTMERDARVPLASLPTEFVAGEWIMSGQAEPDAVVTYARVPSPETGHVGWCWWARGKMGDARDYVAAREAAEKALRAHAAKGGPNA